MPHSRGINTINMNLNNIFKQLGYSKREALIYLSCIELGKATATELQKKTKLSRSTIYYSLDLLMSANMISILENNKKKYYIAEEPENIKNLLEDKKTAINSSLLELETELPLLRNTLSKRKEEASVKYFIGVNSLANLHVNLYRKYKNSNILLFSSKQDENSNHFKKVFQNALAERLKNKIFVRGISPATETKLKIRDKDREQLRESRFLPVDKFPFKSDLMIFDDIILYQSSKKEQPIAAVLSDQNMVDTMKMIFELAWEAAEKYDEQTWANFDKLNQT
jgi:sugar-specific transcriptional regulator TrmB